MQCKSTILIGECVHGSSSYPFTFPLTSRNMAASMHIRWETEINYTMATRSSSLFNRNQDTTSEQLLISEEKNHWIRIPKSWVALEDSLLTMTAVTTWTMGRADQTRNLNFLLEMYNIRKCTTSGKQYDECKHTRPWRILQSEPRMSNIAAVLVNPFDIALDRTKLINLSTLVQDQK